MTATGTLASVDHVSFYAALAAEMNAHPERYEPLGDVDIDLAVVVRLPADAFRVRLLFQGIRCENVTQIGDGDEQTADCWLDADVEAWQAMVDDIRAHGRATGEHTLNSLTLVGQRVAIRGEDPMGVDRFFRFNQTLQTFFDGAAVLAATPAVTAIH